MTTPFTLRNATAHDIPAIMRLVRGLADYEKLAAHCTATEADFHQHLFGPNAIAQGKQTPAWKIFWTVHTVLSPTKTTS